MSVIKGKGPLIDPGLCRCCGTVKKCRLLNVEYEHLGRKEVYSDIIMDCYGLLLSHLDSKPTERLVCATCVSRLREAYSFRKQVLRCEEAFLQMKMCYNEEDNHNKIIMAMDQGPKLQIELVKMEPDDKMSVEDSLAGDTLDDRNEYASEEIKEEDVVGKNSDSDDVPLSRQVKRPRVSNGQSIPKQNSNRSTLKDHSPRLRLDTRPSNKQSLSKVQQLIRERDPSYMTETNILTIVEFSYVVPFKCRHNNLICYYCGQHFSDPQLLREHSTKDHHPKKFRVIEHKKMIKIDMTRIDCRLCPTSIDNMEEFKRHITSLHGKKYYFDFSDSVLPFKLTKDESKCALCDEVFPYFHALNKHMNKHFSNYVCETCGLGFVDKGRFFMHQQRHEGGDFPCEVCGKVFKASYNKDLHVDRVHKKKGRVFCPKCDEKLMSYPQKLKHLVEVHGEEPLSFPCKLCERVFETRRMLTLHRRKEHLKDFRYECQYCGQKFFTRFALNNHLPTHTGERNFKCKVCEKTYPRLKTLKDHMRIHTNDRRYRCHICGQAFIQNCSLKGHMKSQHPEYG